MPKVSVIIPAYNRALFLEAAASSVLQQTFTDLELIIVDDGSQDETREVCGRLSALDARVRYLYQDNKGPAGARNTGIRAARGQYIALLDADDFWHPAKLEKQVAILDLNADVGVVYCRAAYRDANGQMWPDSEPPYREVHALGEALLYANVVEGSSSAVVTRAQCFGQVGLFDESLRGPEDWDMWLRLAEHYRFAKVDEVLVYITQHASQLHRNVESMTDAEMTLMDKVSVSAMTQKKDVLRKALWYNRMIAAEQYCAVGAYSKSWHAQIAALRSWPVGALSPRSWYVLALSLSGPLYPQVKTLGSSLRYAWHHLKLDSLTRWTRPW